MLLMVFCVQTNQFLTFYRKRCFQMLFALLMTAGLAEWLAASLLGADGSMRPLLIAAKCTELLLTPLVPYIGMLAISGERPASWKAIPVVVNVILQLVSLPTGIVFHVDELCQYTRGPVYLLYVSTFIVEAGFLAAHSLRFSRHYQYTNALFLILVNLLAVLAVTMEFLAPYLRLDWTCVSYAAIMLYIYYDQLVQQVDALTDLLNRKSFDCAISQLRSGATIVFFDVDQFKSVNDIHGHKFGDECLSRVAQEIRLNFEKHGYCYRYGGDEFCVLLRSTSADMEQLVSSFLARIRRLREKEPRIPFVSIGYARYDQAKETIDEAISRADEMMYRFKQMHRETPYSKKQKSF